MPLLLLAIFSGLPHLAEAGTSGNCACPRSALPGPLVVDPLGTGATAAPRTTLGRLVYAEPVPTWIAGQPIAIWVPEGLRTGQFSQHQGDSVSAQQLLESPLDISYQLLPAPPDGDPQTQSIPVEATGYMLHGGSTQWVVELQTEGAPPGDYWLSFSDRLFMPIRLASREPPRWHAETTLAATWWSYPDSTCPVPVPWLEIAGFDSKTQESGPLLLQIEVELDGTWTKWGVYSPQDGSVRLGDRDGCEALWYRRPAFTEPSQVTRVRVYQWGSAPESGQVISRFRSQRHPRRYRLRQ